jgi:O-acetyl-ADP-ribose deacetylase (regulator of RNase III)
MPGRNELTVIGITFGLSINVSGTVMINPLRPNLPPGVLYLREYGPVTFEIVHGDLTEETSDAIVNAANEQLQHGAGVAAAIVGKGGEIIQIESDRLAPVPVGEAVVTGPGALSTRFIIHAVGPRWQGGGFGEDEQLAAVVENCLVRANELGLESMSMPAISCGIFSYPPSKAAGIIIRTIRIFCRERETSLRKVRCVILDKEVADLFSRVLQHET